MTGVGAPLQFQEFEAHSISIKSLNVSGKVVRPTHRSPLSPRRYSWYSFLLKSKRRRQRHCAAGRIKSIKLSNFPIGNRILDRPTCSAEPRPTAPPCILWSCQSSSKSKYLYNAMKKDDHKSQLVCLQIFLAETVWIKSDRNSVSHVSSVCSHRAVFWTEVL
jgi:hypothetical protein